MIINGTVRVIAYSGSGINFRDGSEIEIRDMFGIGFANVPDNAR